MGLGICRALRDGLIGAEGIGEREGMCEVVRINWMVVVTME